jgi:sialic acid synthase SpsE
VRIGKFDTARRVLVVAEIGNNHEGDFAAAQELVRQAAAAGADAVKFQTFRTELFVRLTDVARFEQLRRFELTFDEFAALSDLARSVGLLFISTPLDLESAAFLPRVCDALKIASGDNNFVPLIECAAASGRPLIVSGGLATLDELRASCEIIRRVWRGESRPEAEPLCRHSLRDRLAVLHCVASYPTPAAQTNLSAIATLGRELDVTPGYSDHTLGVVAAALSVVAGARVVEKHFTLDKRRSSFRDHALSADPHDMRELVRRIREYEPLIGDGEKRAQPCEAAGLVSLRRSIVARRDLAPGQRIRPEDLLWQRPGDGLAPGLEAGLLGQTLARALRAGENVTPDALRGSADENVCPRDGARRVASPTRVS